MHHREECLVCDADGELGPTGESIYRYASRLGLSGPELCARIPGGHRAWCIACHGTGLADIECDGCGNPVAADTINEEALTNVDVLVHPTCDTGHRYFDTVPVRTPRGENFWGSREVEGWR